MQSSLRIGVIGTGNMGRNHVRILSEDSRFELASIHDSKLETAKGIASAYGVSIAESTQSLINDVEAVVIATPSYTHRDLCLLAAEKGVHTLVEKPMALNCEDAKEVCEAFDKAGKKLMIGHVERFNPVITEMLKVLKDEEIVAVEIIRHSPFDARITDTGVIYDLMIHDIDIVCNALCKEEISEISGFGSVVKSNMIDYANCLMKFETGLLASLSASRITESKVRSIHVHTQSAYIAGDLLNRSLNITKQTNMIVGNDNNSSYRQESVSTRVFVPTVEPLKVELLSFYDCIMENSEPAVTGAHAEKALTVAEKLEKLCNA